MTSVFVTESMYKQAMMALMRYFEKYRHVEKFSALLHVLLPVFAQILMKNFDDRRKLPAANWIRQNIARLTLFMESAPLLKCASALQNKTQPASSDLREVLGTTIGNHLFKCFRENLMVTEFLKSVNERLDDLENLDFAEDDVEAYHEVMKRESTVVKAAGIGNYTVLKQFVPFLATQVKAEMAGPNGVVQKCMYARVKTIAVHTGQCRLLPWEVLCFSDGGVGAVRECVKLSKGLLEDAHNVRDAALAMLGSEPLTLRDMKKIMTNNRKELLDCDEHFDLELLFLNEKVDVLLLAKLREAVLAPLPSKVSKQTMPSAAAALEKLLREPLCFALGADSQGQVKGVLKVVKGIMEDEPPAEELMKNASDFYKQCMSRIFNFAAVRV